ncbi:hypothetical protein ELH73_08910 [Rhizobium leguminosarum]|uniref:Uncharacterized protein n=1 Tax=Rhizobium leguminosarum TaxID=384 RepID=A0ABD7PRG6_RHILE|nr:hypothetical protein [Rhizobium leguminosarum]TAV73554.1 hypothetical protein ELI28_08545 [Rhizobium leguminosarum]TAV78153.1 hypothetical protein ELI27_08545 [Rhizobium leguminosarum]TAW29566.1 hypothetical protein ELI19_08725 [Rhizobium leguminosarum]TAW43295.1 hypothetical protein ELI18_08665 [Rhizobium leguminosarum]TAZ29964.1 hypothetical protein ELH73_08910 [Rhizobium leguminosarum]
MNKGSHAGKGYGRSEEKPPDHPGVFENVPETDHDVVRYQIPGASSEAHDDDESSEGRNWAILLTVFSVILVQISGIALIVWAVF